MRVLSLTLACLVAASAAHAAGTVEVNFVSPDQFADVGRGQLEIEQNTVLIAGFFKGLANKLPDGQALKVEVLDVDLAGELKPFARHGADLRLLRGRADWPSMTLRYTLQASGRTLSSGEERISDMNYTNSLRPSQRDQPLAYERRMVERWFSERLAPQRTAAR